MTISQRSGLGPVPSYCVVRSKGLRERKSGQGGKKETERKQSGEMRTHKAMKTQTERPRFERDWINIFLFTASRRQWYRREWTEWEAVTGFAVSGSCKGAGSEGCIDVTLRLCSDPCSALQLAWQCIQDRMPPLRCDASRSA